MSKREIPWNTFNYLVIRHIILQLNEALIVKRKRRKPYILDFHDFSGEYITDVASVVLVLYACNISQSCNLLQCI